MVPSHVPILPKSNLMPPTVSISFFQLLALTCVQPSAIVPVSKSVGLATLVGKGTIWSWDSVTFSTSALKGGFLISSYFAELLGSLKEGVSGTN